MMDNKNKLIKSATEIRGNFIQECVDLEMIMDTYIAKHFCQDDSKVYELAALILAPRIQWREKLEIFRVLIGKYNLDFADKYKNYYSEINSIIEHRNYFAHLPVDFTDDGISLFEKGIIRFLRFKNYNYDNKVEYLKQLTFTQPQINEHLKLINSYTIAIRNNLK